MHSFGVRDVEKILRLPRSAIRALISQGFVSPRRGSRREYRFSFQDLIVLRLARALTLARVPQRRINHALKQLRRRLPETAPLSGLNICAVAGQVIVRDGSGHWNTQSGQYLLALDVNVEGGALRIIEQRPSVAESEPALDSPDAEEWFQRGLGIEDREPATALEAYRRCIEADPEHLGARINCGRLLHEAGNLSAAEILYREGLREDAPDATLLFNLAVLLEDSGRLEAAVSTYQEVLRIDPDFADAHFNLARLHETLGRPRHAIRHLGCYRRLTVAPD
jgi:tetratricopeptide (TPR) repeat protein